MLPKTVFANDAEYLAHLRDWFAGQALSGAIACPTMRTPMLSTEYASMAYQLADAMLRARSNMEGENG